MIKDYLNFEYIDDFVNEILDRIYADEDLIVSVVAKFDDMKEVVKAVVMFADDVDFEKIDITDPIDSGYKDEYVMDVFASDGGVFFNVEPTRRGRHIIDISNDENYIFEDCSEKIVDKCDKFSDTYVVHIDTEDEFEDEDIGETDDKECEKCICPERKSKRDLSNPDKTDRVEYRVNGKSVYKDEYDKAYKDFHEEYGSRLKDVLKRHCEFMDEVNAMLAHFRMW